MSTPISPILTLAPRGRARSPVTITTNAGVTIYITDEVTVYQTTTVEVTKSVIISSFFPVTVTSTATLTTTDPTTITETQTSSGSTTAIITSGTSLHSPTRPIQESSTTTSFLPTLTPTLCPESAVVPASKHVDPFQVLAIVFGVLILFLLALMYWLVRRFYKMYRAERVLRKQLQTEGTEMPEMKMEKAGQ